MRAIGDTNRGRVPRDAIESHSPLGWIRNCIALQLSANAINPDRLCGSVTKGDNIQ